MTRLIQKIIKNSTDCLNIINLNKQDVKKNFQYTYQLELGIFKRLRKSEERIFINLANEKNVKVNNNDGNKKR